VFFFFNSVSSPPPALYAGTGCFYEGAKGPAKTYREASWQ
jgi:hypothetical protein